LEPSAAVDRLPQATPATNIVPIPDTQADRNENRAPQLLDPNDRQALRPIRQANFTREIARPEPVAKRMVAVDMTTRPTVDDESEWDASGWEIVE